MSFTRAPTLETERLVLSAHRREDFEEIARNWADPIVTRFVGGRPQTREETWAKVLRLMGHWPAVGYGYWVLREKGTGRFVGEAGFGDFKREIDPPFDGAPEAGWVLAPDFHGKGYGTEAVRAILAWGDEHIGRVRNVCLIDNENVASMALAARVGFQPYAKTDYKGAPVVLLERLPA